MKEKKEKVKVKEIIKGCKLIKNKKKTKWDKKKNIR